MKNARQEFLSSLDATDEQIEPYLPYILQDLWSLGSAPKPVISLVQQHISPLSVSTAIDFGCGKGAVLIQLAKTMEFRGLGIDIVPAFIQSAREKAIEHEVGDKVDFLVGDISLLISQYKNQDLVIYAADSEILGPTNQALLQLKNCLSPTGWIVYEVAFATHPQAEPEFVQNVENSSLEVVDKLFWSKEEVKNMNRKNNQAIQFRIQQLTEKHPEKRQIFEQYLQSQWEECRELEEELVCSTWLLKSK